VRERERERAARARLQQQPDPSLSLTHKSSEAAEHCTDTTRTCKAYKLDHQFVQCTKFTTVDKQHKYCFGRVSWDDAAVEKRQIVAAPDSPISHGNGGGGGGGGKKALARNSHFYQQFYGSENKQCACLTAATIRAVLLCNCTRGRSADKLLNYAFSRKIGRGRKIKGEDTPIELLRRRQL
jgi:hypothetical protein